MVVYHKLYWFKYNHLDNKYSKWTNTWLSAFILYLSGCSCCPSGSLIGCVRPGGGPGRTGWVSRVRTGRRWELSPCSSSPSPRDGSRGQEAEGPSGCPSSCWHCGSLSSCTEEHKHTLFICTTTDLNIHLLHLFMLQQTRLLLFMHFHSTVLQYGNMYPP